MKNYSLIAALLILLVASVNLAETQPVPEDAAETVEVSVEAGVEIEPTPAKYYSPWAAGLGNLVPGLGYFLIDEPWWGAAELALCGAGAIIVATSYRRNTHPNGKSYPYYTSAKWLGYAFIGFVTFSGIFHAPLFAEYKNEQQQFSFDLSPGVGLDSVGDIYPTVQLTLSF